MGIPRELEDAAALYGAGVMTTIFRVILPVSIPVIVTVVIFQIQYSFAQRLFIRGIVMAGSKG